MAAEAYARVNNRIAAVCVTTGPGATNAITGVLCGWMDSIPMIVLSGQARYDTTVRGNNLRIRTMGIQEFDIVSSIASMTKYAVMVTKPEEIQYHLEKAIYLAAHGRPGPCWLDIPLDVQGAWIEEDELIQYTYDEGEKEIPKSIKDAIILKTVSKLNESERPLLFAGHGIRLAGAYDRFQELVRVLGIPVVTGMSSIDLMPSDHPLYVGRNGGTGDRAGNFAIQTCDLLFSIGSRQGFLQTGFNYQKWAPHAYTILNDIDEQELRKKSLHVDFPIVGDAGELIEKLLCHLTKLGYSQNRPWFSEKGTASKWIERCQNWKARYPVVTQKHYAELETGKTNIYAFYQQLSKVLPDGAQVLVSVGTSRVAGSQAIFLREGQRFYTNAVTASMGYGLPGAIGICMANGKKEVVCVMGEGCLQMNIQELQTIYHHRLPIRIFVINNEGYHSIRQTQNNYFNGRFVGIGEESGDLSFPDLSKLASAYGLAYYTCCDSKTLHEDLKQVFAAQAPCICEVFVSKKQETEPKVASRQRADGTMISGTLEDMAPFLSREELSENMGIRITDEEFI